VFSFDETVTQRTTFTEKVQTLTDSIAKIPMERGLRFTMRCYWVRRRWKREVASGGA